MGIESKVNIRTPWPLSQGSTTRSSPSPTTRVRDGCSRRPLLPVGRQPFRYAPERPTTGKVRVVRNSRRTRFRTAKILAAFASRFIWGSDAEKPGPRSRLPLYCLWQVRSSDEERIEQALLPRSLRPYRWLRYPQSR